MEWEQRFCPNASCASDLWMVQPSSEIAELWQLVDSIAGGTFTVAAVEPVCPRCGSPLRLHLNGESRFGEDRMASRIMELACKTFEGDRDRMSAHSLSMMNNTAQYR